MRLYIKSKHGSRWLGDARCWWLCSSIPMRCRKMEDDPCRLQTKIHQPGGHFVVFRRSLRRLVVVVRLPYAHFEEEGAECANPSDFCHSSSSWSSTFDLSKAMNELNGCWAQRVDVFSKSETWLAPAPVPPVNDWKNREGEILGWADYVGQLVAWAAQASEVFASEIGQATRWATAIQWDTLRKKHRSVIVQGCLQFWELHFRVILEPTCWYQFSVRGCHYRVLVQVSQKSSVPCG